MPFERGKRENIAPRLKDSRDGTGADLVVLKGQRVQLPDVYKRHRHGNGAVSLQHGTRKMQRVEQWDMLQGGSDGCGAFIDLSV